MLGKNVFNMHHFGKWFMEQYRFLQLYQQRNDAILRVIDIEQENIRVEPTLKIQVVGKNYFLEKRLTELLSHPNILEAFTRKDVEAIVTLKTQWELSPKVVIKAHFNQDGKNSVVLEDSNGISITNTVGEIQKNKEIIKNLSSKDAHLLGYLSGAEAI